MKSNSVFYKYTFTTIQGDHTILIALLSQYPFQSFEERDVDLLAYIEEKDIPNDFDHLIDELQSFVTFEYSREVVENKNWNAEWEANFKPITIDDFCRIRAEFHNTDDDFDHEIVISPKMAFGTGHHETTYMMMKAMQSIDFRGKKVFDYGCGTGILAILAEKLGAKDILAIDYDIESANNTIENAELNQCSKITSKHAELSNIEKTQYQVILANINRHVLLEHVSALYSHLSDDGILLISGILNEDRHLVSSTYEKAGFVIQHIDQRGDWLCLRLGR